MKLNTQSLRIGTFIFERLNPLVPTYPNVAEQGARFPFATYHLNGFAARDTKDRYNYEETLIVEVDVVASTAMERTETACRIKETLEGWRGEWEGTQVTDVALTNASDLWKDDAFIMQLFFSISIDNSPKR